MEYILEELLREGAIDTATEMHLFEEFKLANKDDQVEAVETLLDMGYVDLGSRLVESIELNEFPEMQYVAAEIAFLSGDMDTVLLCLSDIDHHSDVYVKALILEAEVYAAIGLPDVSEKKLKELRHHIDDAPIADVFLAEFYYDQGEFDKAYDLYFRLLETPGYEDKVDLANFAELSYMVGQYETALNYFGQVLHPEEMTVEQILSYADLLMMEHDVDKAIEVLEAFIFEHPYQSADIRVRLGQIYMYKDRIDDAKKTIRSGLDHDEKHAQLLLFDAMLAKKEGNFYRMESQLYSVLEYHPENMYALDALVEHKIAHKLYDDVLSLIDKLESIGEYDPHFDWYRGKVMMSQEKREETLAYYEKANEHLNYDSQFIEEYVGLLTVLGEVKQAQKVQLTAEAEGILDTMKE